MKYIHVQHIYDYTRNLYSYELDIYSFSLHNKHYFELCLFVAFYLPDKSIRNNDLAFRGVNVIVVSDFRPTVRTGEFVFHIPIW